MITAAAVRFLRWCSGAVLGDLTAAKVIKKLTQDETSDNAATMWISGQNDTIAAIATPPGRGGIGVVRISGPGARDVLAKLWKAKPAVEGFESHRLYYGPIGVQDNIIDRVLVALMKGPRSYTGEDVVEISAHGGPAVLERVLYACCDSGARLAQPGEFTRRAYLNGRLDLVQAEAVADIIAASSEAGLKNAQEHLAGRLSKEVNRLHQHITDVRAFVEAAIDFPEEDIDFIQSEGMANRIQEIIDDTSRLSRTFEEGRLLRDGVRVVIAGRPNAGKSSLFNALAGCDRSIVHGDPGTTRDVVEEAISIGDMVFFIRDTAGLCDADHEVERMGVARARNEVREADVIMYVIDATVGNEQADEKALNEFRDQLTIVVYSKCDLVKKVPAHTGPGSRVTSHVSSVTGDGLIELKNTLLSMVRSRSGTDPEGVVVTNARHRAALDVSLESLCSATSSLESGEPVECAAQHLRKAQDSLALITGETSTEALLDEIFSRFCIGK